MGKDCQICGGVLITGHENVSLGDRVTVNDQVIIQSCEGASITIGNDVTLSYRAMLITGGLIVDNDDAAHRWHQARPVVLGDSVWVAAGAIVLPGVTVGTGAIVAAGSVVTQDVDVHTVVAGRPAKVIRVLEQMNR